MDQQALQKEWANALKDKIQLVQRVGATPDGKALLDLLTDVFENRPLKGADPYDTYYNLGQRDVVQYLRELAEYTNG